MPKKIQIAVVGCGYWGPNLIRNFSALPQCLVRYVCDKDEKRLAHMKQLYPQVETTKEFEKIVGDKEVDAVVVATPSTCITSWRRRASRRGSTPSSRSR